MPLSPPQDYRKTAFTHRRGLAADRPLASDVLQGTLYFSTNLGILERSTGIVWELYSIYPGNIPVIGPPGIDGIDGEEFSFNIPDNDRLVTEVNFTPVIQGSGGQSGQVYATQSGLCTKIGRLVTFEITVKLSTLGTITGFVFIGGQPFSASTSNQSFPVLWDAMTTAFVFMTSFMSGANIIPTAAIAAATSLTTLVQGDLSNTSQFQMSGSFSI